MIAPPAAVGGLFLWAAVGDVPFINVELLPDDGAPAPARPSLATDIGEPPSPTPPAEAPGGPPTLGLRSELVVATDDWPVTLAFAPDGRLLLYGAAHRQRSYRHS